MGRLFPAILVLTLGLVTCGEAASRSDTNPDLGTVTGRVLLGPMCPVMAEASPCPDEPMPGETVELRAGGTVVATATSDAEGAFSLEVEPGSYELVWAPEGDPGIRSAKPLSISVEAGETVTVDVLVDTGIR